MSVQTARRGASAASRRRSLVAPTRVLFTQPAEGFTTTTATKTTPTFNVQSGDLITVIGYTVNVTVTLATPTFTGTGTATLAQSVVGVTSYGNIYLWTVAVSATATGRTISITQTGGNQFGFHATVWRSHAGMGASAKTNAAGAPSLALTAGLSSAVEVGVNDWNALTGARTWRTVNGAVITESLYVASAAAYTCYAGYVAANTAAGSLTLGLTAPTGQAYSTVAVEVLPVGGAAPPPNILGVAYWRAQWDAGASYYSGYFTPLSQTGDSNDYYDCSYGIDAYVSLFEATGATAYLTSAITLVNNMIADAAISSSLGGAAFGDSYLGWITQRVEVQGEEVPLYESYAWRYVCRLLTALKNNATVYANSTFKAHYDSILAFTETNIFDKWYNRGLNPYIYRQNTNMAAHWAYISLHLRQHTLNSTRQTRCDSIRSNIDSVGIPNYSNDNMRAKMTASLGRALSGAYSWASDWGDTSRPGQDVAHACAEITFICESKDYFSVWTQTDIDRFTKTMTDLIMPTQREYVDGTGVGNGWLADGWPKLGRFSVPAQLALEAYDSVGGGQGQYYASMCANAARWGVA